MINKNIGSIDFEDWHNTVQAHLAKDFEKQGYVVNLEKNIPIPVGGNKTRRRADIVIPQLKLIVEVQKSKDIAKDWKERNEDYKHLGYSCIWIMHDNRWQPDSDQNPELENETADIYIKWRNYNLAQNKPQFIYNSARFAIIDYVYNNPEVTVLYAIPTAGQSSLMYRKVESVKAIKRTLTPKFTDKNHFGVTDFKNHNQPPEEFSGYEVITSIISKDTFKLKAA